MRPVERQKYSKIWGESSTPAGIHFATALPLKTLLLMRLPSGASVLESRIRAQLRMKIFNGQTLFRAHRYIVLETRSRRFRSIRRPFPDATTGFAASDILLVQMRPIFAAYDMPFGEAWTGSHHCLALNLPRYLDYKLDCAYCT